MASTIPNFTGEADAFARYRRFYSRPLRRPDVLTPVKAAASRRQKNKLKGLVAAER